MLVQLLLRNAKLYSLYILLQVTMKLLKSGPKEQLCSLLWRALMTFPREKKDQCVSAALMKV